MYCGPKSTSPNVNTPVSGSKITLDAGSAVLSQFTVQAPSGAVLTIDSGTVVLMLDSSGTAQPIPAGANISIALDDGDASVKVDITGIVTVAQFRITATVNGKAAELRFMSNTATTIPGMPVTGAHWSATLTDTAIHSGSRLNLYKISGSTYTLIWSQIVGVPSLPLAKKAQARASRRAYLPMGPDRTRPALTTVLGRPPRRPCRLPVCTGTLIPTFRTQSSISAAA